MIPMVNTNTGLYYPGTQLKAYSLERYKIFEREDINSAVAAIHQKNFNLNGPYKHK